MEYRCEPPTPTIQALPTFMYMAYNQGMEMPFQMRVSCELHLQIDSFENEEYENCPGLRNSCIMDVARLQDGVVF